MFDSILSEVLFIGLAGGMFALTLFPPHLQTVDTATTYPAKSVVMLDNSLASYLTINDGTAHIQAISKFSSKYVGEGMLDRVYPDVRKLPFSDDWGIPDPELLLSLHADATLTWGVAGQMAKDMGLPGVIELWIDPKDPIRTREQFSHVMGQISGHDDRATALLDKWAAKRNAIRALVPKDSASQIKVAWVYIAQGNWGTTNSLHWSAYRIDLAGAQNVGKGFMTVGVYDTEEFLQVDPDVILFDTTHDEPTSLSEVLAQPVFQSLRAVRNKRIYRVPQHNITNEPFEDLMILTWMAEIFYPDVMPHSLREEYKQNYREFYHYSISDDEIDRLIYLSDNKQAAGYERFSR